MIRIDLFITDEQSEFFHQLEGNFSENIRKALDDYIIKLRRLRIAPSASVRKESE